MIRFHNSRIRPKYNLSSFLISEESVAIDSNQFCVYSFLQKWQCLVKFGAAVFCHASEAFGFVTEVFSGLFFRWTRAPFRGHAARRACPTRKGPACDFGRGRRACSRGRRNHGGGQGKSFRSARLGRFAVNWQCFRFEIEVTVDRRSWSCCWRASGRHYPPPI